MQPMFGLTVFVNEDAVVPVVLQNDAGVELTSLLVSSCMVMTSLNGATYATPTPGSVTWSELGRGVYEMTIPAAMVTSEGVLDYFVQYQSCPAFLGHAQVGHRLDVYEVRGSPQYDEVTQDFTMMVCLMKNGQVITTPTNCQIWVKDTLGAVPVNLTSVSPNADGVFILSQASVALSLNMNYELKMQVTDINGKVWTSVDFALTFN